MKKSRFTEEQVIAILKQHEAGVKTAELCREHGISAATFYAWKSKCGGMDVAEAKRLKGLEDENRRLKQLVARQKPRYGCRRLHVLLERRGHMENVKRIYWLYVEEGLSVRRRKRKRVMRDRAAESRLLRATQEWAMASSSMPTRARAWRRRRTRASVRGV